MPTPSTFYTFYRDLGRAVMNLNTDTISVALSNVAPDITSNAILGDITQISAGNGYTTGGYNLANVGYGLDNGVAVLVADDLEIAASGGTMATWRYAVYYDNTPTSPVDPLIAVLDVGEAISLANGESRTLDHDPIEGIVRVGAGSIFSI